MREKLCFNLVVPSEKKDVVVGMKVSESTKRILDRIADEEDRTISYITRELMLRGLSLYQSDGKLKDDGPVAKAPPIRLSKVAAVVDPSEDDLRGRRKKTG